MKTNIIVPFFRIFVLSLYSLVLLTFFSCKEKTNTETDIYKFEKYIQSFPNEIISNAGPIAFVLKDQPKISKIEQDVVSILPKIKGEIYLKGNTLEFVPQEKLKSNTEYQITLHLNKLYPNIEKDLQHLSLNLKTKELLFTVSVFPPRVVTKDLYFLEGTFTASDFVETAKIKQVLRAQYNEKNKAITIESSEKNTTKVSFQIDSLARFEKDKIVQLLWNGKAIGSKSTGETNITIAGKNRFEVLSVAVIDNDKQHIEIVFSDIVSKNQNLNGLLQFTNNAKIKFNYSIKNNTVTIYPKAEFKESVDLEIFKEIKNEAGVSLASNTIKTLYFEEPKPNVSFINSGTILPDSENLKLNFYAVNLKAVDATIYKIYPDNVLQFLQSSNFNNEGNLRYVGRPVAKYTVNLTNRGVNLKTKNAYAIDLSEIIPIENGAMYRVELSFSKAYANYSCTSEESTSTISYGKKEVTTKAFDNPEYYERRYYNYNWRDRDNPCTVSYYYNKSISTNILATSLGAIVKKGTTGKTFIAVSDIISTAPVSDATIKLYNLQKQELYTTKTDSKGIAIIDNKEGVFFAKITKGKHTTYVKLKDGNALSMSQFDVSGSKLQEGLKGYIYGDRGVWRPGDQLFFTFVLNDANNPLPEKHPITFELSNPRAKIIDRTVQHKTAANVYAYAPKTSQDALTGNYILRVRVGAATFTKKVKIETIKPNRLKIAIDLENKPVKADTPIRGKVQVNWLHGAIAKNLKFDITSKFYKTKTTFSSFKGYQFDDLTQNFRVEDFTIMKGTLNDNGGAQFAAQPKFDAKAPGMLKANLLTKVYENGGDFSTDVFTTKLSPYTHYVGLKAPKETTSSNYLYTDKSYNFEVAAVDENGTGNARDLVVTVYKLSWSWWWNSSENGLYDYSGSKYHEPYDSYTIKTNNNGKGSFALKVSENDWGRYLIKVKDKRSKHTSAAVVYFDWPSWYAKKKGNIDKSNATMLVFTTDKDSYKVSESATVKFPSSAEGRALLTIENGSEVLDHFWIPTKEQQTTFTFPILPSYSPNIYVSIALLQKHQQSVNDLPIRMYGTIPISVYDAKTKLQPEVKLPKELVPESTASIEVSEKNGKAMTYTIAIVDEGLLDLTRFKTPNPWNSFYAKQSLGVKTWDIYDDVIGAYGGKVHQILSIGGDESEAGSKNKKANRFEPMVRYLGPFQLAKGTIKKHEITIPKYVGAVRAMVVASDNKNEAYGSTEKAVFVRKPVMILASLPRKITPQETVTLPVTVFAMKPSVRAVNVTVKPDPSFTIIGTSNKKVSFTKPDEKMVYFTLKVNDFKGIGNVDILATSGKEKASYSVEIDVLNPNPISTEVHELVLQANESGSISFENFGTKGTNMASLELSTLPPMNFTKRLQYLVRYPHGCIEQSTSSAFPQLYFTDLFSLSKSKKADIDRNIKATVQRISNFQLSSGGLSYWQGDRNASNWGTSYAGHFMLEAAKKGYVLPIGFLSKWIHYQKQEARNWRNTNSYRDNDLAQAYRLYTLCLANAPDLASMNRLREASNISNDARIQLAGAYALLGKQNIATSIVETLNEFVTRNDYSNTYGSALRNKAMALETYSLLNMNTKAIKAAKEISASLSSETWMSTQTTAFCLLAISNYAIKNTDNTGLKAVYTIGDRKENVTTSKALYTSDIKKLSTENTLRITNTNKGILYVRLFQQGILPVGEEKVVEKNLEIDVVYRNKNGKFITPDEIQQGTNIVAQITVKNTTNKEVENIALTQFLPSGWEVINTRFTGFSENTSASKTDYTDIRDASIRNYFRLKKFESKQFKVLLNASYLGNYYLPGLQAEGMYDNSYFARTKGKWITVIR